MKFISKEYLQRFDFLASVWENPHIVKPVSALDLAEKEILNRAADAEAITEFSMRRLKKSFDPDELCEREILKITEKTGETEIVLENGVLTLVNPEFIEREAADASSDAARTVLKAFELHTLADRFQLHLLLRDEPINELYGGYRYYTANCDLLRFEEKDKSAA